MEQIEGLFAQLISKDCVAACGSMEQLREISRNSDAVYPYFDRIAALLSHRNSLVRNRALLLLAANAQWDEEDRFAGVIVEYLTHIADEKPITARQCIQSLPTIAAEKPRLADQIRAALANADITKYADSMRPLVQKDIENALMAIGD